METHSLYANRLKHRFAACIPDPDAPDHHYGRRIERDRTWTVYHVFTGVPASVEGRAATKLSRTDATETMQSLNRRNARRRRERIGPRDAPPLA